jgi:hypothetical protein
MTIHDTYGTSTHTVVELAQLLADQLGLSFVEHDSDYRGVYLIADTAPYRIEVQPNAIPGDHEQDDLYDPEHPEIQALLLVTGPDRDNALNADLNSIDATSPGDNLKIH